MLWARERWTDISGVAHSTEDEFRSYVSDFFLPHAPQDELAPIFDLYPADPAQGSPFGTGDENQLAPMYKRMAAFQGDFIFQAPRRWFLDERADKQPMWSFSKPFPCIVPAVGFGAYPTSNL